LTLPQWIGYNPDMAARGQAARKLWGSIAAAGLCASGCTQSSVPAVSAAQTSAGIKATLTTTPTPAHTGDDTLILTLSDAQTTQPIGDANVTARAEAVSPRLPGQPNSGRAQGNGVYQVPVVLAVASSYHIQVQAERPGLPTATFSFLIDAPH
jgi:hypothetical protein